MQPGDGGYWTAERLMKLADLEQRIKALEAMRRSLTQLVATCDRPRSRRECPLLEALADGDEDVDSSGPNREARFISRFDGFQLLPHLVPARARPTCRTSAGG